MTPSYESKKDEKLDSKQRTALVSPAVVYRGSDEQHFSEVANSSGDLHFVASLETERTGIGFSVNVADSSKSRSDRTVLDVWSPGETPPVEYEVLYGTKRHQSESEQESSSRFGIALGADATGDPGDALHYKTDASGFSESDITFIARVENYLNATGATYPWVERTYQRQEGRYRGGLGVETEIKAGSAELTDYSSVGTQTLPDVPAVVLVTVQPGTADLQKLLAEYRDRATKVARWEAELAETTDPGMRNYLQGLISTEQSILADIAAAAIASGATQEQLNQIALEAEAAVDGDGSNTTAGLETGGSSLLGSDGAPEGSTVVTQPNSGEFVYDANYKVFVDPDGNWWIEDPNGGNPVWRPAPPINVQVRTFIPDADIWLLGQVFSLKGDNRGVSQIPDILASITE